MNNKSISLLALFIFWLFFPSVFADSEVKHDLDSDFGAVARHVLGVVHAEEYEKGNFSKCVSLYTEDAKFYGENRVFASGKSELLKFYTELFNNDGILQIKIGKFIEIQKSGDMGWVIFNYTKKYELKEKDASLIKQYQLEGEKYIFVSKLGTAIFQFKDEEWKIERMIIYGPERWSTEQRVIKMVEFQ